MKGDYFLYFYIEDLAQLLMTLPRKVIFSESEHFAQLLLAVMFVGIKSLQIALQIHCAFHNQARETINICTPAVRFPKFLQHLSFFYLFLQFL